MMILFLHTRLGVIRIIFCTYKYFIEYSTRLWSSNIYSLVEQLLLYVRIWLVGVDFFVCVRYMWRNVPLIYFICSHYHALISMAQTNKRVCV